MSDEIALSCAEIFLQVSGLGKSGIDLSASEMLSAPMETFDIDSLTTMEFVMAVEDRFAVELDEKAVNGCRSVGELAELIAAAQRT